MAGTEARASSEEARAAAVLNLFSSSLCVVKCVKNDGWLRLVEQMRCGLSFRSSVSLPPPSGRGMCLFGRVSTGAVGLVFDRRALPGYASAFIWPSGYYAKTEHNIVYDRKGNAHLIGGREKHLCTLRDLIEANVAALRSGGPPLSYNEINLPMRGADGLIGVFARSWRAEHLLLAMGVRSLLAFAFPGVLGQLPLLVLTSEEGAMPVPRSVQLQLLRQHAQCGGADGAPITPPARALELHGEGEGGDGAQTTRREEAYPVCCTEPSSPRSPATPPSPRGVAIGACEPRAALEVLQPRLPIDLRPFPELTAREALSFHAAHGATHQALADALSAVARQRPSELVPLVHLGLAAAAELDNAPSARELVRCTAPLLLVPAAASAPAAAPPPPCTLAASSASQRQHLPSTMQGCTAAAAAAVEALTGVVAPRDTSRGGGGNDGQQQQQQLLSPCAKMAISKEVLVAVGAQVMLAEFVSGGTTARLQRACVELDEWLAAAQRCSCASVAFLLRSWQEARRTEPDSRLSSFFSDQARANRRRFALQLRALQETRDGVEYCRQLRNIVGALRRPCLRLRLLQEVLGLDRLDGAFSRDVVHAVVRLASDIVERMAGGDGGGGSGDGGSGSGGGGGTSVQYDRYDEATRLEAEALYGDGRGCCGTSDPLGEEARLTRRGSESR